MALWEVTIASAIKNETSLTMTFNVTKDSVLIKTANVVLEGDTIDVGALKGRILKVMRRLKGMDEDSQQLIDLRNRTFTLTEDETDLVLNQ